MSEAVINERELILDILLEASRGEYLGPLVKQVLDKHAYLNEHSRAFIKAVCEGVTERKLYLDYIIEQKSSVKISKMKPLIRELLRMSVYQLKFMAQIPSSAAINEAVKLAKKRKFNNLSGFVNGVLRNIDRMELPDIESIKDISIRYSCPRWIVDRLISWYGAKKAEKMLAVSLEKQPLTARVCLNKNSQQELIDILGKEKVKAEAIKAMPGALELQNVGMLEYNTAFAQGRFTIQDVASQLVGVIAAPEDGMQVLDLCAAPGGKSCHIAELLKNGSVVARDVSERKLELIEDNANRLDLTNIITQLSDASVYNSEDEEKYDLVLADVPCSGLGVFSRKSDLKYRLKEEDLKALEGIQRSIIDNAVRYVRPGGILIYSTCTVNPGENIKQLEYITDKYNFAAESIEGYLPEYFKGRTGGKGYIQLLQGIDPCDGFFICRLKKQTKGN